MFLAQMLVVNLVGASERSEIRVVRFPEPLETLMDEDVMDHEICGTINGYPQTDIEQPRHPHCRAQHHRQG